MSMIYTVLPDTEIYTTQDKKIFVIVDFRKDGEVYYFRMRHGQTIRPIGGVRTPTHVFEQSLRDEGAFRVDVTALDWLDEYAPGSKAVA